MLKQTSLFLLLGALAVAPPAYAQSEGDEAESEEGTEEEPEAPAGGKVIMLDPFRKK